MQANKEAQVSATIKQRLWAFKKGFYLETVKLCNINKNNYKEYLSDRDYLKLHPVNKNYSSIIDNKLYLPFLLKDYPALVPQYYYFIDKGRLLALASDEASANSLIQLCKTRQKLVFKHCWSSLGRGFYLLEWKDEHFLLNKSMVDENRIIEFIKSLDNYIVTEFIHQHRYSEEINPGSVNTVRLLCVWDNEKNESFIPNAFYRFGLHGDLVDNLGDGGGILAYIDIVTGKMKNIGLTKEKGEPEERIAISVHPDSKKRIDNVQIPRWRALMEEIITIMNHLSFIKYAGVDVVITENGFKILELNCLPTLSAIQVEEGLLKDERLRKFFNVN